MNMIRSQRGFSILDMMVVLVVTGVLGAALIPHFYAIQQKTYYDKHTAVNQSIVTALKSYALRTTLGTFPTPYTGGAYTSTVYNPSDVSTNGLKLTAALNQEGIASTYINDDGSAAQNVRVYQLASGITEQVPLYFQSGPLVTLSYQVAAVYLTQCAISTSSCNPTSSTGIPGTSTALTTSNYATWTTTGTDLTPVKFSNRDLQEQLLTKTTINLDKIRDKMSYYVAEMKIKTVAGDTTNWFPSGSSSLAGQSPATNQGCRDGWYNLATDTVLPTVGMTTTEFGTTAWGGPIQYCRDYDPTGTKTANASPHFAALRIHASVSSGIAPDSTVTGNNIVLTF